MKKIISILVAFASTFSLAFAEGTEISFSNKIYEEDYVLEHTDKKYDDEGESKTEKDFPGIKEKMSVELTSEQVDAMVAAIVTVDDYDEQHFGVQGEVDDWYIEFRPIHPVTFGMHTSIYADGSYLPIYDDNIATGDIGSSGFTVTFRPTVLKDALRLSFSAPFDFDGDTSTGKINWFNGSKDHTNAETGDPDPEQEKFDFRLGAIYNHDYFNLGVSIQDVADDDERQIGVYLALPTLLGASENLTIGGGFATAESEGGVAAFDDLTFYGGISYKKLVNGFLTYETDAFSFKAEALYNFGENFGFDDDDEVFYLWDFYSAASVSFKLAEKLTASLTGKVMIDLKKNADFAALIGKDEKAANVYAAAFALDFDINERNTVGAEFDIDTFDGNWAVAVPVYWEYHF
ncbi:hypothetical protein [Treponema sp. UBA3813]|uniref:hypothetical protein n=1 Tax=Treponema sp. UBA3813 TaxID=1947715 RepID=UPI0025F9DD90|nr:hypothetical protein [Treponema sp. UBA3813]